MRPTFRDPRLHNELRDRGFVRVPVLNSDELQALRAGVADLRPADGFDPSAGDGAANFASYHCTFLDTSLEYRRAFDRLAHETLDRHVERLLVDHAVFTGNCYVKPPGAGEFEVHQNWQLTASPREVSLTIWLPTEDTTRANGTLALIPGSHKLTDDIAYPRGSHYFSEYQDLLAAEYFEHIDVAAGEAVFFDDSIIHGSDTNRSDSSRHALQVVAMPNACSPALHLERADGRLDVVPISKEFFLTASAADMASWPEQFPASGAIDNPNAKVDRVHFDGLLAAGAEIRSRLWAS